MQIDLRTVSITPLRQTYNHIADRLGADKTASRYLEGTMDMQATANFHYRPTWEPQYEIFDVARTRIQMVDWYSLKDPRQYYYGVYTQARARLQESAEADFALVEERGLAQRYSAQARGTALAFFVPLRHVAWGANMNGASMCAYGYGTAITQPCLYAAMDQLGMAQYLTRLGLLLGGQSALETGRRDWLEGRAWQELRRYVEDTLVLKDWFELFVAQNAVLDSLLFTLAYREVDNALSEQAGPLISLLTRFQAQWYQEHIRWVDSVLKLTATESAANRALLQEWLGAWQVRAHRALAPIAELALGQEAGATALANSAAAFTARLAQIGLAA